MSELYFCLSSGGFEIYPGGGFDVCCDQPELHIPVGAAPKEDDDD